MFQEDDYDEGGGEYHVVDRKESQTSTYLQ